MAIAQKFVGSLLVVCCASPSFGLVSEDRADESARDGLSGSSFDYREAKALDFADAALECGVYYEYTAGGMKNNPNVPSATIRFVSQNSASLLGTADQLYQSAGLSIKEKYDALIEQARVMFHQQDLSDAEISDIIYAYGDKCRRLLMAYPEKLEEISELLGRD